MGLVFVDRSTLDDAQAKSDMGDILRRAGNSNI